MEVLLCLRHTSAPSPTRALCASPNGASGVSHRSRERTIIPSSTPETQILANTVLHFAVFDRHPARWNKCCDEAQPDSADMTPQQCRHGAHKKANSALFPQHSHRSIVPLPHLSEQTQISECLPERPSLSTPATRSRMSPSPDRLQRVFLTRATQSVGIRHLASCPW